MVVLHARNPINEFVKLNVRVNFLLARKFFRAGTGFWPEKSFKSHTYLVAQLEIDDCLNNFRPK